MSTAVGLTIALSCVAVFSAAAGAAPSQSTQGIATLAQVESAVKAAQNLNSPPPNVVPTISEIAAGQVVGNSVEFTRICPALQLNETSVYLTGCTFGDTKARKTVALVGDTRAQVWLDTFDRLGKLDHFRVLYMAKSGCPAPLETYQENNNGIVTPNPWQACTQFHTNVLAALELLRPQLIVISSNTELALADPPHQASPSEVESGMVSFIRALPTSSKIAVLGGFPQPASASNPTLCIASAPAKVSSCNFKPEATVVADNAAFKSAAKSTGATFINQTPWFCASTCPPIIASIIVYSIDAYNAEGGYLNYLAGALWASLKPLLR